jgi:hypothetical protein
MTKPEIDIKIVTLDQENSDAAFNLVCEEFANGSVLHKALGVTPETYREFLRDQFFLVIEQGLSLIAIDTANETILGCLVACDFLGHESPASQIPTCFKSMSALLNQLEGEYLKKHRLTKGNCMLVDLAVVSQQANGLGIYRKLRETAHHMATKVGFKYVVGELSSSATQYVCVKRMGHKVIVEIEYASFEYGGKYPFADIKQPASIQLVEYQITS